MMFSRVFFLISKQRKKGIKTLITTAMGINNQLPDRPLADKGLILIPLSGFHFSFYFWGCRLFPAKVPFLLWEQRL